MLVHELHLPQVAILPAGIGKSEVQDTNCVDGFQLVIPLAAFLNLFPQGKSSVVDAAVLEVEVIGILHLDDELLALLVLAVQVVDGLAIRFGAALLLGVEVGQVPDLFPVAEYLVKKVNQQVFVELRAEQTLEAKISEWIDVSFFATHPVKIINGPYFCTFFQARIRQRRSVSLSKPGKRYSRAWP